MSARNRDGERGGKLKRLHLELMITDIIHKSKVGLEILVPLVIVMGTTTTLMIVNLIWVGLIVCGVIMMFLANIYAGTYYKISSSRKLFIHCGLVESFEINVDDIEWIKESKELTNAPALSIDRLEIVYKGGRVLISPRDKRKFIGDLKKLNPGISFMSFQP